VKSPGLLKCIQAISIATLLVLLCSLSVAAQTKAPSASQAEGAFFVAYRTPKHVTTSTPDVFHGIANDLLAYLEANEVRIVKDPERGIIQTDELFSLQSLLNLTKNAGATHLLYLTVDRPIAAWVKVTLQCYDLSEKLLWQEQASVASGMTGKNAPAKAVANLKKKIQPRIGQPGLPKVEKTAAPST